jgi:hypothetical protein
MKVTNNRHFTTNNKQQIINILQPTTNNIGNQDRNRRCLSTKTTLEANTNDVDNRQKTTLKTR